MIPQSIPDQHIGIINGTSHPRMNNDTTTPSKPAIMKCSGNCKCTCYFHSRAGCTIDNPIVIPIIGGKRYLKSTRNTKRRDQ
jgi:hypothetical protein